MDKEAFRQYIKEQYQIEYTGFTTVDNRCAIVFLFPYYVLHDPKGNLSLYAYSIDYHQIILSILKDIIAFLEQKYGGHYTPYADISPYDDKAIALQAGLGVLGKNNLLINEKYGTFVFIGYILCDLPFPPDHPLQHTCLQCGKCVTACPSGALKDRDFSKCLSAITQKKQALTPEETRLLQNHTLAFGCDTCQLVCPCNHFVQTPLSPFFRELKTTLSKNELEPLSSRQFRIRYQNRAFSWRGKNVLLRNLGLIKPASGEENPPE